MTIPPRTAHITRRERDVLNALLHDGATNYTIGRRLGLGEETIKTYMRNLLAATGSKGRTGLIIDVLRGRVRIRVVDRNRNQYLPEEAV